MIFLFQNKQGLSDEEFQKEVFAYENNFIINNSDENEIEISNSNENKAVESKKIENFVENNQNVSHDNLHVNGLNGGNKEDDDIKIISKNSIKDEEMNLINVNNSNKSSIIPSDYNKENENENGNYKMDIVEVSDSNPKTEKNILDELKNSDSKVSASENKNQNICEKNKDCNSNTKGKLIDL